jgi:hypothetical protein
MAISFWLSVFRRGETGCSSGVCNGRHHRLGRRIRGHGLGQHSAPRILSPPLCSCFSLGKVRCVRSQRWAAAKLCLAFLLKLSHSCKKSRKARSREVRLGKRIRDEVQVTPNGESLQIASCRPKSWTQLTTISYEGEFYELVTTKAGPEPLQFVYFLRKKPFPE